MEEEKESPDPEITAWRNVLFRSYAYNIETEPCKDGLKELKNSY